MSCGKCSRAAGAGEVLMRRHTCVLTICNVHIPPFPQIATSHGCVSVQKMQPSTPPCSVTKDVLPAGVAVTDSEKRSNMGYGYKVY